MEFIFLVLDPNYCLTSSFYVFLSPKFKDNNRRKYFFLIVRHIIYNIFKTLIVVLPSKWLKSAYLIKIFNKTAGFIPIKTSALSFLQGLELFFSLKWKGALNFKFLPNIETFSEIK